MQTFLPYPSYEHSAEVLDDRRLGKQRVETMQIMGAIVKGYGGWSSHPAVKMWKGYEYSLVEYQVAICTEWHVVRGYRDSCLRTTTEIFWDAPYLADPDTRVPPWWLGDPEFHLSHRAMLVHKDPDYYGPLFPDALPTMGYIWPV